MRWFHLPLTPPTCLQSVALSLPQWLQVSDHHPVHTEGFKPDCVCLNADIFGNKYNKLPQFDDRCMTCTTLLHRLLQIPVLLVPTVFKNCSHLVPHPSLFFSPSWPSGNLADARLAVLQCCLVLEASPDSGPTTWSAPWTNDRAGPVCWDWANFLLHRVFLWTAFHLVHVAEFWG